jgi:hypothetical protein
MMNRKDPDSPNGWDFECGGGVIFRDGKPHWPDCLTVWLRRRDAYEAIRQLSFQLQDNEYDAEVGISLTWCGELEEGE